MSNLQRGLGVRKENIIEHWTHLRVDSQFDALRPYFVPSCLGEQTPNGRGDIEKAECDGVNSIVWNWSRLRRRCWCDIRFRAFERKYGGEDDIG